VIERSSQVLNPTVYVYNTTVKSNQPNYYLYNQNTTRDWGMDPGQDKDGAVLD
jgi:hypothetical protein